MSDFYDSHTGPDLRDEEPQPHPWRHPLNIGHLVMGLAFLGLVAVWAVIVGTDIPTDDVQWLLPVPWVLAGGAGLVATAVAARRSARS